MSPRSGGGVYREWTWRHFIYGGMASCLAEFGTFPLDTTKTRLQLQGQHPAHLANNNNGNLYTGMFDAMGKIVRGSGGQEGGGIGALYRGLTPALLRQSTYGSMKFGAYYGLKRIIPEEKGYTNFACAVVAGMTSSALANPTDVLKVRMQAAEEKSLNIYNAFRKIWMNEGVKGLWRGVGPTSQRAGVIAGVELPVYDACKRFFIDRGVFEDKLPNHVVSSFLASLAAAICSTPLDVVRTRMMTQKVISSTSSSRPSYSDPELSLGRPHIYKSAADCILITVRHEGVLALWRGFLPAWLRMGPWNVIFFVSYEWLLSVGD